MLYRCFARVLRRGLIKSLLIGNQGSFAPAAALLVVPLCLVVGLGVDLGNAFSRQSNLKAMADAAALVAAGSAGTREDAEKAAKDWVIANNAYQLNLSLDVSIMSPLPQTRQAAVRISARIPTMFMHLAGIRDTALSATASAQKTESGTCLYVLDPRSAGALTVSGPGGLVAPNCDIQVNSSSSRALRLLGGASISSRTISISGDYEGNGYQISPRKQQLALRDPLVEIPEPDLPHHCAYEDTIISNKTIPAGRVFCGTIVISGNVVLAPGMHYFRNAIVIVDGDARLTAQHVAMVLNARSSILQLAGSGHARISALTEGDYAGIAILGSRTAVRGVPSISLASNRNSRVDGAIYAPRHQVHLKGSADANFKNQSNWIIAWTFTYSGNSEVTFEAEGAIAPKGLEGPTLVLTR